ncbi:hypothetical protein NDN08_007103 [Rhodosorus marinus]|uniref:ASPIC/UnbV domain-containing protein n=1 Tax=Rhodosorus marinus TaxID=101924 RepID=A0AAV8UH19_9RHOD|nr:hypothetical protein NDN08_007103 [Rhodosorus marinus]
MGWRGSVLVVVLGLILVLAECAKRPFFEDVSHRKGIQSLEENHRRVPLGSKYDGATIADLDGDGWYDLVLSNHGNNAEWYWSTGDGSFEFEDPRLRYFDVHGTAAGDVDNDGKMEVIIAIGGSAGSKPSTPVLYTQGANGRISRTRGEGHGLDEMAIRGRSVSFVDIDNDGDLDLIYTNKREEGTMKAHLVYENTGEGQFVLRKNTGIESADAWKIVIFDINEDGNADILFFTSFGPAELYLGTGDFKFTRDHDTLPLDLLEYAHCIAIMDYDNDGDLDLFIVRGSDTPRTRKPNTLLENRGTDGYTDVAAEKKLSVLTNYTSYFVTYGDFNNDGYIDLYVTISTDYTGPRQKDLLFVNEAGIYFREVKDHGINASGLPEDGNSAIAFDFNMDGNMDLLTGNRNSTWRLYENKTDLTRRHYLFVRVGRPPATELDPGLDRNPLGAVVRVYTGRGEVFTREVGTPGRSHAQAYMDTLHFGLRKNEAIEKIVFATEKIYAKVAPAIMFSTPTVRGVEVTFVWHLVKSQKRGQVKNARARVTLMSFPQRRGIRNKKEPA